MAIISIFGAAFSQSKEISAIVSERMGFTQIDDFLLDQTSKRFGTSRERLQRAMEGPPFLFNKFTHYREQYIAQVKLVLAETLKDDQLISGYASHLISRDIDHVLRVCVVSDPEFRANRLKDKDGISLQDAQRIIREEDQKRAQWTHLLYNTSPWDSSLYDIKIPVDESNMNEAVDLIVKNAKRATMTVTENSQRALADFILGAKCEMALIGAGHYHAVSCKDAHVFVIVDSYVMRLEKLEAEIEKLLMAVDGVSKVTVKTGPNYRPTTVFTNTDFELPEKVLLVDDEKDFVMTLSERLQMRDLDPAVAYSGEEALALCDEEKPDVIVLDLKMPGIDGFEVLRQVKNAHSDVEVIILTGHGSEKDRAHCMELGAFAYLEKPVDIEVLSETMKSAKEAIEKKKE